MRKILFIIIFITIVMGSVQSTVLAEYDGTYNDIYTNELSYGYRSVSVMENQYVMSIGNDGYPFNDTINDLIDNKAQLIICTNNDKTWIIDTGEYGVGRIGDLVLWDNEIIVLIRNETKNWLKSFDVYTGEVIRNLTELSEFRAYDVFATAMLETDGEELYIFEDEDMTLYKYDLKTLEFQETVILLPEGVDDVGSLHAIALAGENVWVWFESKATRSSYGRSVDNPAKLLRVDIDTGERNYEVVDIPAFENAGMTQMGWMIEITVDNNEMIMYWSRGYYTIIPDILVGSSVTEPTNFTYLNQIIGMVLIVTLIRKGKRG